MSTEDATPPRPPTMAQRPSPGSPLPAITSVVSLAATALAIYVLTQAPDRGLSRFLAALIVAGWVALLVHSVGYFATRRTH